MKKILALILSILLVFGLAGCGAASGYQAAVSSQETQQSNPGGENKESSNADSEAAGFEGQTEADVTDDVGASEEAGGSEISAETAGSEISDDIPDENGVYDSKEDVALYLWCYGQLPDNYITKSEAKKLGWEGGSVEKYAPGKAIGGDHFGNYEGLLPQEYDYYECDIDTLGADSRGAKRIIFSEGAELIYYTEDHYNSFELLYGEE